MKGKTKSKMVDRYLEPIRNQIVDLVTSNSNVFELGCGSGSLLLKLAPKVNFGLGIDKSKLKIDYCLEQKKNNGITNIDFKRKEIGTEFESSKIYDYSIVCLFFHVLPKTDAIHILTQLREMSKEVIICGFVRPQTIGQSILLRIDQFFLLISGIF